MENFELTAIQAADAIRTGHLTSVELVASCLERTAQLESSLHAWASLRPEHALAQAKRADQLQSDGATLGVLHGVPVGIKDIFDTADFTTEQGSALFEGRAPTQDAYAVRRLREAGAVILGKTVTTEFAGWSPGKTVNPHDSKRTPGGSSSGSAAAVAAQMVPVAIGSQTAGSTIRPASFCGVVAFKPQFGAISRAGSMYLAQSLDHVGIFARCPDDVALMHDVMCGPDEDDDATTQVLASPIGAQLSTKTIGAFKVGFARTPFFTRADEMTQELFEALCRRHAFAAVELPDDFEHANYWLACISAVETAANFDDLYPAHASEISSVFCEDLQRGHETSAIDYLHALEGQRQLRKSAFEVLRQFDAVVTPAATGEAPLGLQATGDPCFCSPWTLLGAPAVCVPLMKGPNNLPVGIQIVGTPGRDIRVLEVAKALLAEQSS